MNKAKKTARKRRELLRKGMEAKSTSFLGKWARRIFRQAFPPPSAIGG